MHFDRVCTTRDFLEVKITEDMRRDALFLAHELGVLRNSATKGDGNFFGKLGEQGAVDVLGGSYDDTRDFDLRLVDGTTVEVKTKARNVPPLPDFNCHIFDYNTKQRCDVYLFISLLRKREAIEDRGLMWLLGWLPKDEFYARATFFEPGGAELNIKGPCWGVRALELYKVDYLINGLKEVA